MRKEDIDRMASRERKEAMKRKKKRIKKRAGRKKRIVLFILAVLFVGFGAKILSMEYKYYSLSKQKDELTNQINEEKIKSKELKEELSNSKSKSYIEYLARKYLGLIYPNEKVYVTNEKDKK